MEAQKIETPQRLPLVKIRRDGGTQPRAEINEEWAQDYAEQMLEGARFPAVVVFFDGSEYWLADGFHRCRGAEIGGFDDIAAEIRSGTRRDAVLHSAGANGQHGHRRTNADKRRAVMMLLNDSEWSRWSGREIARQCGVHHQLVGNLRHSLDESSSDEPRTYTTRHGTVATMNTGNIGRTPEPLDEAQEYAQAEVMGGDISREEANERLADIDPQWDERARQSEPAHHLTIGTGQNEWYTPAEYIAMARDVMGGIDLDPASCEEANETVKAAQFYTKEDDGLSKEWQGRVWLNPPYSRDLMPAFVQKLCAEYEDGGVEQAILVSHNNTDTNWFQSLAIHATAICFPKKRIRFYRNEDVAAPTNGQAFFYLGDNPARFKDVFAQLGIVVMPV